MTPAGSAPSSSCIFSLTPSITASGFSPKRITTQPVTTSPCPFRSEMPRRISGPSWTVATSPTVIGVPPGPVPSDTARMSSRLSNRPRPRTTYSVPPISSTRPPTSWFDACTALTTRDIGMSYARSLAGSTAIWYCFSKPPNEAISATPGTAVSAGRTVQSWRLRSSARLSCPDVSARMYCMTQPTPVASGPSIGMAPSGSLSRTPFRYSSTRERAQYRSTSSSNTTYTADRPNWLMPRTNFVFGTLSSSVDSGYVT